jgi:exopolyphosphatase/guanosine-5'-triphosphate,3'-diphosphate pyrophosphatase
MPPPAHLDSAALPTVGRWEWRAFGADIAETERRLATLPAEAVHESDELYVLSPGSDASVKLRDGVIDVKELQDVRADGLQQWLPVLKAPFPLDADAAGRVLAALGVGATLGGGVDSIEELLEARPELRVVGVHKLRRHYAVGGCMAELTELTVAGRTTRTVAVEANDPELVSSTGRALGLGGHGNTSVARGIKRLASFGGPRFAIVDVGTNSVKFLLAERAPDGTWRTLADRAELTRLGEDLERTGRLGAAPMARTADAIAGMAEDARRAGVEAIAAVGTAGLRIAANAAEFVAAVQARCAVGVEVISGDDEARLAYLAATSGVETTGALVVFDTGGGSSQFTFGDPRHVSERFSLNVGAVGLTERFALGGVVSEDALASALGAIAGELSRLDGRPSPSGVIGMGGAVTNLAAVKHGLVTYDHEIVQGTVLDRVEIDRQIDLYRTRTAEQRRAIVGLQPARAEVILAGACIVRTVLTLLGADALTVSDRALRHGLLTERFALAVSPV